MRIANKIRASPRLKVLFDNEELAYKLSGDPDRFLEAKPAVQDPKPQPGFVPLRSIPKRQTLFNIHLWLIFRPRKMLPLLIGIDEEEDAIDESEETDDEAPTPFSNEQHNESNEKDKEIGNEKLPRRHPSVGFKPKNSEIEEPLRIFCSFLHRLFDLVQSRVLENLRSNPALAPLFEDDELMTKMSGTSVLTPSQKMSRYGVRRSVIHPRAYASKTKLDKLSDMDSKVKQVPSFLHSSH